MGEISKCLLTNVGKQTHYRSTQWTCKLPDEIAAEAIILISDIVLLNYWIESLIPDISNVFFIYAAKYFKC